MELSTQKKKFSDACTLRGSFVCLCVLCVCVCVGGGGGKNDCKNVKIITFIYTCVYLHVYICWVALFTGNFKTKYMAAEGLT